MNNAHYTEINIENTSVTHFMNQILHDAIDKKASDIHFEPYEKNYRIRFRQDGILYEIANPPLNLSARLASRIKILSQLDIAERRLPQDGRFMMNLPNQRTIDCRVSTCPTLHGEKIVIRLLDATATARNIDALGFNTTQKEIFLKHIYQPQGMILVTGPTGSGKTITLYTALQLLNNSEKNILTIEDPIEIKIPGINQVQINVKTGLHFSTALRAFLRQDPDIIMLGEMRDLETAEIAMKSAETGHLVFSTLHTNNAPETITRLMHMGISPLNISTSVSLIIAQRLIRRLCVHCKTKSHSYYQAIGCQYCQHGYKDRIGIYEILEITQEIKDLILKNNSNLNIKNIIEVSQLYTLQKSGLEKVQEGITSLDEISRVLKNPLS